MEVSVSGRVGVSVTPHVGMACKLGPGCVAIHHLEMAAKNVWDHTKKISHALDSNVMLMGVMASGDCGLLAPSHATQVSKNVNACATHPHRMGPVTHVTQMKL